MDTREYLKNIPVSFFQFAEQIKINTVIPLHSMYVVGSVLTPDFIPGSSDINSLVIPEENNLKFLDSLINLGKEFRGAGVAPPLVMTAEYINDSLDVFPMEFYNFQAIHHALFGEDLLCGLKVTDHYLRLQCEREIKAKLLWLGQVYIETLGDQKMLSERLAASITGYFSLFRAILHLTGCEVPRGHKELVLGLGETFDFDTDIFEVIYQMKATKEQPLASEELCLCFRKYYQATEHVAHYVDQLSC